MLDVADFGPAPPYLCLRADEDLRSSVVLTGQRAQVSLGPVSGPSRPEPKKSHRARAKSPSTNPQVSRGSTSVTLGDLRM